MNPSCSPMRFVFALLFLVVAVTETGRAQPVVLLEYDGLLESDTLRLLVEQQSRRDAGALRRALDSGDAAVRARAALGLASVQDPESSSPLVRRLTDGDARVRAMAAFALGQLRDSTAGRPLLDALHIERNDTVRHYMHDALGEVAGESIARAYMRLEIDRAFEWRHALALARTGLRGVLRSQVATHLATYLHSPDAEARRHAAYFFWRVSDLDSWNNVQAQVRSAFSHLSSDDPAVGYLALALAGLGDPDDLNRIIRLAQEAPDWRTRDRAVRAIARFDAERVAPALFRALDDPSHHVRATAARSLADRDDLPAGVLESVKTRFAEGGAEARLRGYFARALARNADDAHALSLAKTEPALAAAALAESASEESLTLLLSMVRSPEVSEASAALVALRTRWTRDRDNRDLHAAYVNAVTDAMTTRDVALVYGGAPLLSDPIFVEHGSPAFMSRMFSSLEMPRDVEAAVAIVQAATLVNHPDARALVADARRYEHPAVRIAAGAETSESSTQLERPDWALLGEVGPRPAIELDTERGSITIRLFADLAPVTVGTILRIATDGQYEGVPFHRVVSDFVVQGGDFARGDGFGGPGFEIPSEFTPLRFATGVVGMASAGKDTEGSQFFITHSMQPHLDGRYTAYGLVIEGQEVVDAIEPDDRLLGVRLRGD